MGSSKENEAYFTLGNATAKCFLVGWRKKRKLAGTDEVKYLRRPVPRVEVIFRSYYTRWGNKGCGCARAHETSIIPGFSVDADVDVDCGQGVPRRGWMTMATRYYWLTGRTKWS